MKGRPVSENDDPHPISVYGKSKLAGEKVALSHAGSFNVVSIRAPGIYGPGDKEIFSFFQTAYRRIKPVIGDQKRRLQLVHVDDLCEGVYRAAVSEAKTGSVYFIAENRSYAMGELVGLLQQACRKKGFPLWIPGPLFVAIGAVSGFLFKLVGATPMLTVEKANELLGSWEVSTDKARDELGFESQIGFAEGALQTYQWYLKQGWL
jgi:nucleoside-diphosphate-sugar epimerase